MSVNSKQMKHLLLFALLLVSSLCIHIKTYDHQQYELQEQFDTNDAQQFNCYKTTASTVKVGGYVVLKGSPCKVTRVDIQRPNRFGYSPMSIRGADLFTGQTYEDTLLSIATIYVPNYSRAVYKVLKIDEDDTVTLIPIFEDEGSQRSDLKLPAWDVKVYNDLKTMWETNKDVEGAIVYFTVITIFNKERIISGQAR